MVLNDIDIDRGEQQICCDCVYELQGGGKSDTVKKVRYSILYGTD